MKSPVLLCSTAALLALSACATPPSERSVTLRRGKLIVTEAPPAAVAPVVSQAPAPVAPAEPAPAVATSAPAAPEPVAPVVAPTPVPPPPPAPVVVAPPPPPPAPVAPAPGIVATRSGGIVQLSWTLPASEAGFRGIEVMRNNEERPTGRTRVRAVRATVTTLEDTVPDAAANYWYWLKLTHVDGTIENLGPFAAPAKS